MIEDLQKEIKETAEEEVQMELLARLKELKDISRKINALLGRVVVS